MNKTTVQINKKYNIWFSLKFMLINFREIILWFEINIYDEKHVIRIRKKIFSKKIFRLNLSMKKGKKTIIMALAGVGKPINSLECLLTLNLANLYEDAIAIKNAQ